MSDQPSPAPPLCAECGKHESLHIPDAGKLACPTQDMNMEVPIRYFQSVPLDTLEAEAQKWRTDRRPWDDKWIDGEVAEFARSRETALQRELKDAKVAYGKKFTENVELEGRIDTLTQKVIVFHQQAVSAEAQVRTLEAALRKYVHCPHACIDCFCTKEAKAALYQCIER